MNNESSIWLFLRKMRAPLIVLNLAHAIPVLLLTLVPGIDTNGNPTHLSIFDAMYVVGYTATTIGFGEIPYAFTYAQRMVVLLTIYIAVPAWFYALGTLVSLFQDKTYINAIKMNAFRRKVNRLGQDFIIICGYNHATKLLINQLNTDNFYRIVVIDKNPEKIEQLDIELYMPSIPSITADASMTGVLKSSGIQSPRCKYIVTMFDDDQVNLKVSVRAHILNEDLTIISRSSVQHGGENLLNVGVNHVVDIFEIIAKRIDFAFRSPYLFNLLYWVHGGNLHVSKSDILPTRKYIVCSRGRFGKTIQRVLDKNNIEYSYLDLNKEVHEKTASDKEFFMQADIEQASCIIAGTNDDAINLSIIATARGINPNIFAIVRENELEEKSLYSHLRVDKIFILDQIAAIDVYNYIDRPLTLPFINGLEQLSDIQIKQTLLLISDKVNKRPTLIEIHVNKEHMYALFTLCNDSDITIGQLLNNPYRDGKDLGIVILGIERDNKEFILLPDENTPLYPHDHILLASDAQSLEKFKTIVNHYYELYYVIHGVEANRLQFSWRNEN
jgi:voltage-gated potassium channel